MGNGNHWWQGLVGRRDNGAAGSVANAMSCDFFWHEIPVLISAVFQSVHQLQLVLHALTGEGEEVLFWVAMVNAGFKNMVCQI